MGGEGFDTPVLPPPAFPCFRDFLAFFMWLLAGEQVGACAVEDGDYRGLGPSLQPLLVSKRAHRSRVTAGPAA